jgi:16S rRNA G1207 methylase RsmC
LLGPKGLFDRIVMNPPFADQQDIRHVTYAATFLKSGGRLVAIMSAGVAFRKDRLAREFRALVEQRGGSIEELPADAFRASGTGVRTVLVTIEG